MHVKGIRPSGCDAASLQYWILTVCKVIVLHLEGSHSVIPEEPESLVALL